MNKERNADRTTGNLSQLRREAKKIIRRNFDTGNFEISDEELKKLFQKLGVYEMELEMQHDALKRANESLELQQIKFAGLYDLAPVGYFSLDSNGIINEVNSTGLLMLNITKDLLLKQRFQSFVSAEYAEAFCTLIKRINSTHLPQNCHVRLQKYKGKSFDALLEGIAIRHLPGFPDQIFIAVIDMTERMKAEQYLADMKNRLEIALSASQTGTWELNPHTKRFFADDFIFGICDTNNVDFDGSYAMFMNLVHPDDRESVNQHFLAAFSLKSDINTEFRILRKDANDCYVAVRGHLVDYPDRGELFVGTMMNITENRQAEEEARMLRINQEKIITKAILNAQENERKRISESLHDSVSQLLYGIRLNLHQMDLKMLPQDQQIINNLIDQAILETRNISFELAPSILIDFGLQSTIEEMCRRLSTSQLNVSSSIRGIKRRLNPEAEINIFRIVQELVNNSMKHALPTDILIKITQKNKSIQIHVKDNGRGFIKPGEAERLMGSGLQSIKTRLTLYNGTLKIQSRKNKGSTVHVSLNDIS